MLHVEAGLEGWNTASISSTVRRANQSIDSPLAISTCLRSSIPHPSNDSQYTISSRLCDLEGGTRNALLSLATAPAIQAHARAYGERCCPETLEYSDCCEDYASVSDQ